MKITVLLNKEAMKARNVKVKNVLEALKIPNCELKFTEDAVEIQVKDRDVSQFKRLLTKLPHQTVKGTPSIKRALVVEENGEWLIKTEGSSLGEVLSTPGVDHTRTITNNVYEVAEVLGIEAARNVIIKEALHVLEEQGLDVDVRHVMLVADAMTATGEILQVGRHGVSGEKASTLAKAAFEITVPTLVDAAVRGAWDELKGVAENVIVGQQIPMGTGLIDVYMSMRSTPQK
jgi:DNA-directed RNA polymerase beta' subunit